MFTPVKIFFRDVIHLLRWGFLQPAKLIAHLNSLHPELTSHTGFTRQLWLARHSAAVQRFLSLQLVLWFLMGLLGAILLLMVRMAIGSIATLTWIEVLFEVVLALVGTITLAVSLSVIGGVVSGVTGAIAGSVGLGLSLGLAFALTSGATAGAALGVTGGIVLGTVGSAFDYVRRRTIGLSSLTYWRRATVGFIFTIICVVAFGLVLSIATGVASVVDVDIISQPIFGVVFGLAGSLMLIIATTLEMRFEMGHIDPNRLKWHIIDSLLLGVIGGMAGSLTIGALGGVVGGLGLVVLWGVLVGVGGGLAMQTGNGLSATLAAAGLAWLLVASPSAPFSLEALATVATALLAGLFFYVRLPVCLVEVPLTRWGYLQVLRKPNELFSRLRRTPVYWDDLIFYPLPALDQFLLFALRVDRSAGLQEVAFVAKSFHQGWAANRAQLAFAVETLAGCTSPTMIAAAPAELDWLADEVMVTLQQGTREIAPRLLAIAGGVKATLNADNPYSRRLGYREALDGLDTLQRRLPSLGRQVAEWWQPVIGQWQQVLLNELDNVLITTISTATENPYQPGNPLQLARRELFKGRRELRDAVVNALLERNRPTLVLHGPRRMGKTSFLLQLPALLPGNTLPVFLDLQRPTTTQSTAAFLYSIAQAISRDARPYRLLVDPPQRGTFDISPFEAFDAWLEGLALPSLQDFNLLLTFDEFEKLGEAVESGRLDRQIFDQLRYLIQHQTRLALLFAGVQTLDELGPAWSSYFINVKPLTIYYLRSDEAEELIRHPDPEANFNLIYTDEAVTQIMTRTCCHPYLLQLVCSAIVEESNVQNTLHVDLSLFETALLRALDQGEPYFRNVWDEMAGPDGQPILRRIAKATESQPLPTSPSLERLIRRRILTQSETGYTVEIPLIRRWIMERAP